VPNPACRISFNQRPASILATRLTPPVIFNHDTTVRGNWGMVSILPRADGFHFSAEDYDLLKLLARSLGSMLDG